MSLSGLFLWVILGAIALYAVYAIIRWRKKNESRVNKMRKRNNMDYSANIGAMIVALIILFVALPKNGLLMDYRLDYCNDRDKIGHSINSNTIESIDISHESFYACEIGFINGKVEIDIELLADADCILVGSSLCSLNFLILNKDNYQNFIDGENYGFSSTALIALSEYWDGRGSTRTDATDIPLMYDTYYFIINWEYRTSYQSENLSRDYGLRPLFAPLGAYTSTFDGNDSDFSNFDFYYVLDIDYTEDNRKGNL